MLLRKQNESNTEIGNMVALPQGNVVQDVISAIANASFGKVFVSNGDWNLCDLLESICVVYNIKNVVITSYSFTETSARRLGLLCVDGQIENCTIILDHKATIRYPNVTQLLVGFANLSFSDIHAKVMNIQFNSGSKIALIGSANWTNNKRIETLALCRFIDNLNFQPCN